MSHPRTCLWPITSTPINSFWLFLMLDSNVLLLVSNVWLLVLNVWLLAPNVWLLASKVRHWHYMPDCLPWMYDCWNGVSECWHGNGMSDCWHPMSDCCHSMSDCWYQISYCWYRMSDWWYRTHGNSYSYLIESNLKFFVLVFMICKFCFHQEKFAYFWRSVLKRPKFFCAFHATNFFHRHNHIFLLKMLFSFSMTHKLLKFDVYELA